MTMDTLTTFLAWLPWWAKLVIAWSCGAATVLAFFASASRLAPERDDGPHLGVESYRALRPLPEAQPVPHYDSTMPANGPYRPPEARSASGQWGDSHPYDAAPPGRDDLWPNPTPPAVPRRAA